MFNPFGKTKKETASAPAHPARGARRETDLPALAAARPSVEQKDRRFIGVLQVPHQTEKASSAVGLNWYTFRVAPGANKTAVRRAVEERYGVAVRRVHMLRRRPKAVRRGRIEGRAPGFTKAMVEVRAGQSIEFTS